MRIVQTALTVLFILLFVVACGTSAETLSTTAADSSSTAPISTTAPTTTAPITTAPTTTEPLPLRSFDEAEVYRHVFEDLANPIEDTSSYVPNRDKQEAVITFQLMFDTELDRYQYSESYVIEQYTTDLYPTGQKYKSTLALAANSDVVPPMSMIYHDYHEAYIDVMLKHLTYAPCEKLPDYADYVFYIGKIIEIETSSTYHVYSDGHLYRAEKKDTDTVYFKSEQTVDSAYLAGILMSSYEYRNLQSGWIKAYANEDIIPDNCSTKTVNNATTGKAVTYLIDQNGIAYYDLGVCSAHRTAPDPNYGIMFVTCHRTYAYHNPEENGLFTQS